MAPTTPPTSTARFSRISVSSTSRSPASSRPSRCHRPHPASRTGSIPATGTFVRSTNSFGPILSDRAETIGRGRLAFGFSYQFFSFDHLDGVWLTAVPGGVSVTTASKRAAAAPTSSSTMNSDRGDGQPVHRRVDVWNHRSRRRIAGRAGRAARGCRCFPMQRSTGWDGHEPAGSTTFGTIWRLAATARPISTSSKGLRAVSAICWCARRRP